MSPRQVSAAAIARPAIPEDDPVWQAVLRAPIRYDEQVTDEERAAMAEAAASGQWIDGAVVTAEIEARRPR